MEYDVAVIGGGPGGYVAALKASHLGLKTAIIEKDQLGGTCLLRGCIPTKTLLGHAGVLKTIKEAKKFGIDVSSFSFDYKKMKENKDETVGELVAGINSLLKAAKIDIYQGIGSFKSNTTIKIKGKESTTIQAKHTIIATGSIPSTIPIYPVDKKIIHDSTSILEITNLPKHLIVIGGGYIGCEFASLFHELGVKVTIVEMFEKLVITQGKKVADTLTNSFKERGINLQLQNPIADYKIEENQIFATLRDGTKIEADSMLVSTGRKPFTDRLHLDAASLSSNKHGFIDVNEYLQTAIENIYAIGDVTGKSMLAHTASYQGVVAAENIAGKETMADYSVIPAVIFTDPEIATVGMTIEDAKEKGLKVQTALFPFQALGKAKAMKKEDGFVEILFGETHKEILGATACGYNASVLIAEMALAIKEELTLESIAGTIHAHPTMAEAWAEASELGLGHPLHLPKRS